MSTTDPHAIITAEVDDLAAGDGSEVAASIGAALARAGFSIVPTEQWSSLRGPAAEPTDETTQALREADSMVRAVLDLLDRREQLTVPRDEVRAVMREALQRIRRDFVEEHHDIAGRLGVQR